MFAATASQQVGFDLEVTCGTGDAGGVRALYGVDVRDRERGPFIRTEIGVRLADPFDVSVSWWPTVVFTALFGVSFQP